MDKFEVYFDFTCPFCKRGIGELFELLKNHPDIDPEWFPCESHPRPEYAPVHSDLAAQACMFIQEKGYNCKAFIISVFNAHFEKKLRIDDIELLSDFSEECGVQRDEIHSLLSKNEYAKKVVSNNNKVWNELKFSAVPGYIYRGKSAISSGGKLVDIRKVEELLDY